MLNLKQGGILKGVYVQLVREGVLAREKMDHICTTLPHQDWIGMYFTYKLILLEMWYQQVVAA